MTLKRGRPKITDGEPLKRFIMVMPTSIHNKIKCLAKLNRRSMASQILIMTEYYFDKIEKGEISASPIDV